MSESDNILRRHQARAWPKGHSSTNHTRGLTSEYQIFVAYWNCILNPGRLDNEWVHSVVCMGQLDHGYSNTSQTHGFLDSPRTLPHGTAKEMIIWSALVALVINAHKPTALVKAIGSSLMVTDSQSLTSNLPRKLASSQNARVLEVCFESMRPAKCWLTVR